MVVSEEQLKQAFERLKPQFISKLETTSLKTIRRALEQELDVLEGGLDSYKVLIRELVEEMMQSVTDVDTVVTGANVTAAEAKPAKKRKQPSEADTVKGTKKQAAKPRAAQQGSPAKDEDQSADDAGQQSSASEEAPAKKRGKPTKQPQRAVAPAYSQLVDQLRNICKKATITIPAAIYKKHRNDNDSLAQALQELLEKHGLSAKSGEREIIRARDRLAKQRDLDGIDTSNIITQDSGRPRRAAAAAAQQNYRALLDAVKAASEDHEDEESSEEEEDNGEDGEEGAEASAGSGDGSVGAEGAHGEGAEASVGRGGGNVRKGGDQDGGQAESSGGAAGDGSDASDEASSDEESDNEEEEQQPGLKPSRSKSKAGETVGEQQRGTGRAGRQGRAVASPVSASPDENRPPARHQPNAGAGSAHAGTKLAKAGAQKAAPRTSASSAQKAGVADADMQDEDAPPAVVAPKRRRVLVSDSE